MAVVLPPLALRERVPRRAGPRPVEAELQEDVRLSPTQSLCAAAGATGTVKSVGWQEVGSRLAQVFCSVLSDGEDDEDWPVPVKVAAAVALEAQNSESKKRKYALAEVARAFRAAREELESIQREAKDHDAEIAAVTEKKAALEASVAAHFKSLRAELPEAELAKAEVEKLCADLAEANFNDSLISTLPTALLKAPDTRGSFDMMVLSQFESEVSSRIADYTKRLDEADSIKAQRGQRLDAAQRILDAAKKEQLQAAEAFTKAKDEEKRREEALGEAKHKGSDLKKLVKSLSDRLHKAQRSLEVFNDGPMAAFAKLRELAPVVEEVMDLEAEGEAEAAEDAEESAEGAVAMEQEPVVA